MSHCRYLQSFAIYFKRNSCAGSKSYRFLRCGFQSWYPGRTTKWTACSI